MQSRHVLAVTMDLTSSAVLGDIEESSVKLEIDDPEAETSGIMEYFNWLAGTNDEELKKLHRELCPGAAHSKHFWQSRGKWRERLGLDVWAAM